MIHEGVKHFRIACAFFLSLDKHGDTHKRILCKHITQPLLPTVRVIQTDEESLGPLRTPTGRVIPVIIVLLQQKYNYVVNSNNG